MIYLASPYTHENLLVMERRFHCAAHACAYLMRQGLVVFCPIVHCHYMACNFELPRTFLYWKTYNLSMLDLAEKLTVLTLDGWRASVGVQAEISHAEEKNIPVEFLYLKEFCVG